MLWPMLGVLGGYALGAALTTRVVFARGRAGFLHDSAGGRAPRARELAEFERYERHQTEAVALLSGLCWVVAVPLLVLRRAVTELLFARPAHRGAPQPSAQQVADRIDELERALGLDQPPRNPAGPAAATGLGAPDAGRPRQKAEPPV